MHDDLTPADLEELGRAGIARAEAERQLAILRRPPRYRVLDRPCTLGDGVAPLKESEYSLSFDAARASAFVPASGAATRMFKDLLAYGQPSRLDPAGLAADLAAGKPEARAARSFLDGIDRFGFAAELARVLGEDPRDVVARGELARVVDALLGDGGLGYAQLPKGLLVFHRGGRTPFEEHLRESGRVHFTVSPEHLDRFRALLGTLGLPAEATFSTQKPSTDTLATDGEGRIFRQTDSSLLLRPAGHGALLENLADLAEMDGDLVVVRNIDNVAAEGKKEPTLAITRALLAMAAALQDELDDDRPLRVCGVVPNTGEPGGGPFWVKQADGSITRQIVESAEVELSDPQQKKIFAGATHFNPVFMVLSLRDRAGRPHDLGRFADPDAVIVTRKSSGGRELVALERPGLWNGAMARWNTVFVEVPGSVFNPVKTVNDLLRPEHQP